VGGRFPSDVRRDRRRVLNASRAPRLRDRPATLRLKGARAKTAVYAQDPSLRLKNGYGQDNALNFDQAYLNLARVCTSAHKTETVGTQNCTTTVLQSPLHQRFIGRGKILEHPAERRVFHKEAMNRTRYTRRDFSVRFAALLPVFGMAEDVFGLSTPQADRNGISQTCESIHQEVVFKASRKRVYEALIDEKKFSQVTDFIVKGASTEIRPEVGGSFSIFGGVITGRHIELVPYERIVQAWRERDWPAGLYSMVRFQLDEQQTETRLSFDHTGFPQGAASHLAPGWWSHYWEPLQKYLAAEISHPTDR
jgi:uncharacterized protein YndB with AHSA1/START domain